MVFKKEAKENLWFVDEMNKKLNSEIGKLKCQQRVSREDHLRPNKEISNNLKKK